MLVCLLDFPGAATKPREIRAAAAPRARTASGRANAPDRAASAGAANDAIAFERCEVSMPSRSLSRAR
jgi:hypothetical protein